jgi:hypothetical protein
MSAASLASHNVSKCGIVETPLIVGGQRVNENEFPHMVNGTRFAEIIFCFSPAIRPTDIIARPNIKRTLSTTKHEDLMKKADCEYSNRLTRYPDTTSHFIFLPPKGCSRLPLQRRLRVQMRRLGNQPDVHPLRCVSGDQPQPVIPAIADRF